MSTARAATGRRRPALAAVLIAAGVLAASGCSFRAGATHGSPTASASASGSPATSAPSTSAPSTSAPSTAPTTSAASPGTGTPASTATPAAPSSAPSTGHTSATATTGTTGAPAGSAPPPCRTADLRVSVPGGGSGTAGAVHTAVELVNAGTGACVLSGHPGVSFVAGDDGHQVGAAAGREGTDLTPVTLRPGATAHAPLRIADTGVFDPATCRPVPVTGLRVYPPDQTASAFAVRPGTACTDGSAPQLTVGTVQPGPPSP